MRWQDHIERNPAIVVGKPVIKGTRITVEFILECLGAGWTESQFLAEYPHVKPADIRAALTYAAHAMSTDEILL